MSKPFAGFLLALSVLMLILATMYSKSTGPLFILLWACTGGFSVYKLCAKPSNAS
jgi:hypothetical protein